MWTQYYYHRWTVHNPLAGVHGAHSYRYKGTIKHRTPTSTGIRNRTVKFCARWLLSFITTAMIINGLRYKRARRILRSTPFSRHFLPRVLCRYTHRPFGRWKTMCPSQCRCCSQTQSIAPSCPCSKHCFSAVYDVYLSHPLLSLSRETYLRHYDDFTLSIIHFTRLFIKLERIDTVHNLSLYITIRGISEDFSKLWAF